MPTYSIVFSDSKSSRPRQFFMSCASIMDAIEFLFGCVDEDDAEVTVTSVVKVDDE